MGGACALLEEEPLVSPLAALQAGSALAGTRKQTTNPISGVLQASTGYPSKHAWGAKLAQVQETTWCSDKIAVLLRPVGLGSLRRQLLSESAPPQCQVGKAAAYAQADKDVPLGGRQMLNNSTRSLQVYRHIYEVNNV